MLVTKDLANKVFYYIDTWGETLDYIAWEIWDSYPCTIQDTPGQAVFGRDIILNLLSVIYQRFITAGKWQKVEIGNVQENAGQVMHEYAIVNLVYVEMTGIYHKLGYNKKEPYRIT